MPNRILVFSSVRDVDTMPTAVDATARSTVRSSKKQTPFSFRQETNVSGLEDYRKSLEMEGISSNAAKLISQSRRPDSIASYILAWNKWNSWGARETIDPFCISLSKIVNHMSTLFDEGLQYWTVYEHRSAILAYHNFIKGEPIDKHPKICILLTRIFDKIPPQQSYIFIWDVDVVLIYTKSNMSVTFQLSEKKLTWKLPALLALCSALRASSIQYLNIDLRFNFNKLYKTWRRGKAPPAVPR